MPHLPNETELKNKIGRLEKKLAHLQASEKSLKEEAAVRRIMVEQFRDGIVVFNIHGKVREVSRRFAKMLGYSTDELFQLNVSDWDERFSHPEILAKIKKMNEKGELRETVFRRKDGRRIDVETSTRAFSTGAKKLFCCIARDISGRKDARKIRRRHEMRLPDAGQLSQLKGWGVDPVPPAGDQTAASARMYDLEPYLKLAEAVKQAAEGIFITNTNRRISYANPAFAAMTGYDLQEIIGMEGQEFFHNKQDAAAFRELFQTIKKGRRWTGRISGKRKDGSTFKGEISVSPLKDMHHKIFNLVCIVRDITLELKIEERLNQAQKMEAIGTLVGGIAHDFNNILVPLIGYADILKEDMPADNPLKNYVEEILQAASKAKNLVKQFLSFSRQSDYVLAPVSLQPVVNEALKLLRSSIPKTIAIKADICPHCGPVVADSTQVQRIIMNLATNAYQAMENTGGRLNVALKQVSIEENQALYMDMAAGEFACLTVADTGAGIDRKIIDKIFNPYFTTRERGKGSGLGLTVAQGIVKNCNGNIRVYSEPGQGAEFRVFLPIIRPSGGQSAPETKSEMRGGAEHILLVDDEQSIARITANVLQRFGYRVTAEVSSRKALAFFKSDPQGVDLMITDMTMPDMTGDILAGEVKKIRPELPIIICTGFSEKMNRQAAEKIGVDGFLMKPAAKSDLAAMIRKLLDKPSQMHYD